MTDLPGIARAAQTTAARALRAAGLRGATATAHLQHASRLAAAAYDQGVPVADIRPLSLPSHRRALRMTATATAATIPAPRTPADQPPHPGSLAEQDHLFDEVNNPDQVDAFRALATTGRA